MKRHDGYTLRLLVLAALLALACAPAFAQKVLAARVNGAAISLDLLDRQFEELLRERRIQIARMNNPAKAKELKREALDNLIRTELLWQEAKAADLAASDEDVDRAIGEVRGRFRSEDAFLRRIEQGGFDLAAYREYTRKTISADRMAERIVERDVRITGDDVQAFYNANPALFRRNEQVKVRQILIALPKDATAAQRSAAQAKIDDLAARAKKGESFDALARAHSDDATRQWGGELDPFSRGEKPKAFEDAAFALKPGAVSGVVETASGFHVLKLEQRTPAVSVSLDEARDKIREYLRGTRGRDAIDREIEALRALGNVEVLTPL